MPAPTFPASVKNRALILLAVATWCALPCPSPAQTTGATLTTLYSFAGSDGANPAASLTLGGDGNFYGTTPAGGANNAGTVYRITPAGVLTTLYSFSAADDNGINADGSKPAAALALGNDGAFYGAAQTGGTVGFGTLFRVTTDGAFTALYSFKAVDGNNPVAAPVQGVDGNLYGTTLNGGASGFGTVYRIGTGGGILTTLYSFASGDGYAPSGALVQAADGNFYGTTRYGGTDGAGTAFQITPGGGFSTIYSFGGSAGGNPTAALVRGTDGNLYGVAPSGGANARGTVFKLTTGGVLTLLHAFSSGENAVYPSGLIQASDGNLYGAAAGGGANRGALFKISTSGTFTNLYTFTGTTNGNYPQAAPTQGTDGNLYGTTSTGGTKFDGTVFRLAIVSHPPFFAGEQALSNGVYYLTFPGNGNVFGYYSYLSTPGFLYHFDLGYEYVIDAADGHGGVYFYDFKGGDFLYTSPTFPFPYLYNFTLKALLYYFPDPTNSQRYNTNGVRFFYNFSTKETITR